MQTWHTYCAGLAALASFLPGAWAQAPIPAAPAPALPGAVGVAPAAAPPTTLWSFLGISMPQKAACRDRLCQSQCGVLLNNFMAPYSMLSGGIIPQLCPTIPSAQQLQNDIAKGGTEGAAAKVKADMAAAAAKRAAIRFLASVDCHYWPDASKALAGALRAEKNECVRWEAALALQSGCCCTKETIEALVMCVSGSDKDNFPSETSERVKGAAEGALYHCLNCFSQEVPAAPAKPPEGPGAGQKKVATDTLMDPTIQLSGYYAKLESKPREEVMEDARRTLAQASHRTAGISTMPTGTHSVYNILSNAVFGPKAPVIRQTVPPPGNEIP